MKQNIITLVILFSCVSLIPSTTAQLTVNLNCVFRNLDGFYECFLNAVSIPNDENTIINFVGAHLPGLNNAAVTRINFQASRKYFIIRQAFTTFPNLRVYSFTNPITNNVMRLQADAFHNANNLEQVIINGAGINSVDPTAFADISNLLVINLQNNQITSLPGPLLERLYRLQTFNVMQNLLTDVHPNLFTRTTNLTNINLNNNRLTSIPQTLLAQTRLIVQFHAQSNLIDAIGRRFLDNLSALTTLNLLGNTCINQNFANINAGNINDVHTALQNCYTNYGGSVERRSFRMNLRGMMTLWRDDGTLIGRL